MKPSPLLKLWHIPLILLGITMLIPLAFMFVTSLASKEHMMKGTESLWSMVIPGEWNFNNFSEVWKVIPFLRFYFNSIFIALLVTTGQVFTSACAAYAFARLTWPGRDKVFILYLATMMVPHAVTMIPNFIVMKSAPEWISNLFFWVDWKSMRYLGIGPTAPLVGRLVGLDSYFTLTVPAMFSAYGTFLLRQFFLSIPKELDEAAKIDGCSYWQIFRHMIIPLAVPGLTTLTIFTFMGVWGSFLWPLITTNQTALFTLPVGLQAFQGQYGTEWNLMMAAALMMILPVIGIFLFGQRFFISGLTVGAVKG